MSARCLANAWKLFGFVCGAVPPKEEPWQKKTKPPTSGFCLVVRVSSLYLCTPGLVYLLLVSGPLTVDVIIRVELCNPLKCVCLRVLGASTSICLARMPACFCLFCEGGRWWLHVRGQYNVIAPSPRKGPHSKHNAQSKPSFGPPLRATCPTIAFLAKFPVRGCPVSFCVPLAALK